ncbi:hypothetical protein Syun_024880 [Stephania yunnanensis]|uniref:Ribosomal RNA processing protein 1 homolog n=1 Tax=Stephania yunnanensis TaxID=152371 RepID=A0AAP0ET61_9MAGN
MAAGAIAGSTIVRNLASTSKATRDRALRHLQSWLPTQTLIPESDLAKIWKGLFYCVWHADKQPFQIELANAVSSLLPTLQPPLCIDYFDAFIVAMRREWSGIDFLRLDKFYLLIRRFLHFMFVVLKKKSWDLEFLGQFMCVLEERLFLCEAAPGVSYHVCGVFLEELKGFLPVGLDVLGILLKPFFCAMYKSSDKVLVGKIRSCLFDCLIDNGEKLLEAKRLSNGGGEGELGSVVDEVVVLGTIGLKFGFASKFFEMGSAVDCVQGNRKMLFGLHESFEKLEKELASLGVEIPVPQCREDDNEDEVPEFPVLQCREDGNEDEVPELVPISNMEIVGREEGVECDNGSAGKALKKSKKGKKASRVTKKSKKEKEILSDLKSLDAENETPSDSTLQDAEEKSVDESTPNGGNVENVDNGADMISLSESVIANLQMQFEKVAAEGSIDDGDVSSDSPFTPVNGRVSKKRKKWKNMDGQEGQAVGVGSATGKSGEKSAKKVKFSMKSNLVWIPHSPLPPQSLRLPPSATPRGSALKKGIPPGPVRECPVGKKVKRSSSGKKARKGLKSVSPAVKRLRKLRSLSV